jgi:hypothetical protein
MEDDKACGPVLPPEPAPPVPVTSVTLFPEGTKVIDISKELGIAIQSAEEGQILGGGYCVMWMLYLALRIVKNNDIWGTGVPYATRREAYRILYYNTRVDYPPVVVSAMADWVREKVNTFNGKARTQSARVIKGSDGKLTSTQGNPFKQVNVMAPVVEPVKKIIRGETKGSPDGDVELGGGGGGGGGGRFYAPSGSAHGYDMHVKSLIDRPQMVRPKLRELIDRGDKPVLFNLLTREKKAGADANSHALLAIYFPAAFTGGVPEVHVLTTYPILPQEIENIRTIHVPGVAKAGRRRMTFRKNRKQKATRRRSLMTRVRKYNRTFK